MRSSLISLDAEDEPALKRQKVTTKKTKTVVKEGPQKIVLVIPRTNGSAERKTFTLQDDFDITILPAIYDTLGCADVSQKPELSWKLSTATAKSLASDLSTEEDWTACLDDVKAQQKKKQEVVPVNILISEDYMFSLSERLKRSAGASTSSGLKKGAKSKPRLLDLDNEDEETNLSDNEGNGASLMEKEQDRFTQLTRQHSKCQLCGPSKNCKIGSDGTHVQLTHNQLRAWSQSLASGAHGVTLLKAPKGELFQQFQGKRLGVISSIGCELHL